MKNLFGKKIIITYKSFGRKVILADKQYLLNNIEPITKL